MNLKKAIKYFILAVSIGLIIVGVISGEAQSVYSKAIRICFECIGVG